MKTKYKVKRPWIVTYGDNHTCTIMLKAGQIWYIFSTAKDSVEILRQNVSIEINREHFEKYFEKVEDGEIVNGDLCPNCGAEMESEVEK